MFEEFFNHYKKSGEALELIKFRVFEMSKMEAESAERPWNYQDLLRFFHDVRFLTTQVEVKRDED